MPKFARTAAAAVCWALAVTPAFALDGGPYGEVKIAVPQKPPRGYVVLFSDSGGWTSKDDARLEAIARAGALAVGVDTDAYIDRAARPAPRCLQLLGDAEGLGRQLQRQNAGKEYYLPILAGVGRGGALAGAILGQAPVGTIAGAVSIDPWNSVGATRDFCPRVPTQDDAGEPRIFGVPILKSFWKVALSPSASAARSGHFVTLSELVPQLEVRQLQTDPDADTIESLVAQECDRPFHAPKPDKQ